MSELLAVLSEGLAGRYTVEREVGRGGMATVFLAEDVKHQRPVAIKVLHPELATAQFAERFQREIAIAARLQHPHILPLYDSGSVANYLFYVMPFVEGESLRDRLNREKQLPLEDAVRITGEVAQALSYAHSRGVVHRDIKPENILLSGGTAVVADFGIARAVSSAGGESQLTQTGTVIGTPAYMSPEQAGGDPDIDGRSDQYSLACVLYELLVATPPFTGPTAQAVLARHSMDMVSPPTILRMTIPDAVEDALLRALNKVPADRFATCALFAEALQRPSAVTGPRRRQTQATLRRLPSRRTLAIGAGVVAVAGVVTAVLLSSGGGGLLPIGPDPSHVAGRYFEDRSPDHGLAFLADGLTEGLIGELSRVAGLEVISRNGVAQFRGATIASDSVARALDVGTVVEGSVAGAGDRLRVSVALVNGATGDQLADTSLERPRSELFALQDDLAKQVALFLRERLGESVALRESRAGTRNAAAWELLQRARATERAADGTPDAELAARERRRADSLLARAEAGDNHWPAPIVERGWLAYRESRGAGFSDRQTADRWIDEGLGHAERALRVGPGDPDALELRGTLRYWRYLLSLIPDPRAAGRLRDQAEADLRAAVDSNPAQASAWTTLTHLLLNRSETAEAKLAALRAYEGDPYLATANVTVWRLFATSLDLEDAVQADHWCELGGERWAEDPRFTECRLWRFTLKGIRPDIPEAWRLLDRYVELSPAPAQEFRRLRGQMMVAMALARVGLKDSARATAERSRGTPEVDQTRELAYLEAIVRNLLGEHDEAIRLLGLYLAQNPAQRSAMARDQSWWFANLRDDRRFLALVGPAD